MAAVPGRRLLVAALVALVTAAFELTAAVGTVWTLHFVQPALAADLPGGVGLLLCAILPLVAGAILVSSGGKSAAAQRSALRLARILLVLALIAIIIAGLVTAFAVGFTLADSPPFDRRGLDVTIGVTNVGFYGGLVADVLALVMTFLIRVLPPTGAGGPTLR